MSDEDDRRGQPPPVEGWPAESAERLERAAALRARGIHPYPEPLRAHPQPGRDRGRARRRSTWRSSTRSRGRCASPAA